MKYGCYPSHSGLCPNFYPDEVCRGNYSDHSYSPPLLYDLASDPSEIFTLDTDKYSDIMTQIEKVILCRIIYNDTQLKGPELHTVTAKQWICTRWHQNAFIRAKMVILKASPTHWQDVQLSLSNRCVRTCRSWQHPLYCYSIACIITYVFLEHFLIGMVTTFTKDHSTMRLQYAWLHLGRARGGLCPP